MQADSDYLIRQLLAPAMATFFLVWGLIGVGVGTGLLSGSTRMLRFFGVMNRYVSTRKNLKVVAMTHDIDHQAHQHRRLVGALFVLGAAYSVYGAIANFNTTSLVSALGLPYPPAYAAWVLDSVRLALVLFSVLALVVGLMLSFSPRLLHRIEAHADRWVSLRKMAMGVEKMNMGFDNIVEASPRTAGALLIAGGLFVAANAAWSWLPLR